MAQSSAVEPLYGEQVLTVEPYSTEQIPATERHGSTFGLFALWLGANLTIADFALGFLPVSLGLSLPAIVMALTLGNVLGGLFLAAATIMGPRTGYPQMIASRWPFGRAGSYLPASLNWLSTVGWFTVNNILGTFALRVLFPALPFALGAAMLVVVQVALAIFGYNLVHAYERVMALVLGLLFLILTVQALSHSHAISAYHGTGNTTLAAFAISLAAAFSYIASWSPYASDYSRYLPRDASAAAIFLWTALGSIIASLWLEILGVLVAILAGPKGGDPIASAHAVMGGLGTVAVVALILGVTAADALNLYSNGLSARALDLGVSRVVLTMAAGLVGLAASLYGSGNFSGNYQNFLLTLDYWITPWLAILLVDFLTRSRSWEHAAPRGIRWNALISYVVGVAVSVPFMAPAYFTGPIARLWGGADFSYFIGFLVAGILYWLWLRFIPSPSQPSGR